MILSLSVDSYNSLASVSFLQGHHDERLELVCIMSEWDLHDRGYLDFEAFLSVVSTYMKVEQLDQKVEEDFLKVCGLNEKQVHDLEVNLARQR